MILVFGSINLDIVFRCPRLPGAGETLLVPRAEVAAGGKGANQALAAARDGAAVALFGAVGRDSFAEPAVALLGEGRVDLAGVRRLDGSTGCASVAVAEGGENAIIVGSGANGGAAEAFLEDAILQPGRWLLLQMEVPLAENWRLIRRAKAAGLRIALNLAPFAAVPPDILPLLDLLILNEVEAEQLAAALDRKGSPEKLLPALAAEAACDIILTLGGAGLRVFEPNGGAWGLSAYRIEPVDTTGAGDCFCGVLLAGLERGLEMTKAATRAAVAAALSCTGEGAQPSFPRSVEIDARLADTDNLPHLV